MPESCGLAQEDRPDKPQRSKYYRAIEAHLDYLTEHSLDSEGDESTAMWLATIDIRSNGLPQPRHPKTLRWTGSATSAGGANLYWDQPTLVAAYEFSRRSGCACYQDSADAYLHDFMELCVSSKTGLFAWGHGSYFDVVADQIEPGRGFHECHPHTPAWEILWGVDRKATERMIRAMAEAHILDRQSGRFTRVAPVGSARDRVGERHEPSLPTAAVLIDSLSWLGNKTQDRKLSELALRVARFSWRHRDPGTQLVPNRAPAAVQPVADDGYSNVASTAVGLWAGSLLRAGAQSGDAEFRRIADQAVASWLTHGFDESTAMYYERLSTRTGEPFPRAGGESSQAAHAEVFDLRMRPTGNYPLAMAEAALSLFEATGKKVYREAVERWVGHLYLCLPANEGRGGYAEDYGRAIHFLLRAADVMDREDCRELAARFADEALDKLYVPKMGMFRSHPGEDRCDAIDGPGILILALLYLDSGDLPESAFRF